MIETKTWLQLGAETAKKSATLVQINDFEISV